MTGFGATRLSNRAILKLTGPDCENFLEGLLTQTVKDFEEGSARYAAILTPQGKILSAMLLFKTADALYLDLNTDDRDTIERRLMMYKLRADVTIEKADDLAVVVSPETLPNALISAHDPRTTELGFRSLIATAKADDFSTDDTEYRTSRYALGVPEGSDFAAEKDFWLESDAVRLNGVSFSKGCYVGQEITARMKYRTSVKKKIVTVKGETILPEVGTEIMNEGDKLVGDIRAANGTTGLAFVRLERLTEKLTANGQPITVDIREGGAD